ncbi:MAG: hypothetical protein JOZ90_10735 [Alphaproteobacteria bacterium]|nr:hypothetical protein [Alphaproteobacteria bacterium]MBV9371066.1 hypothetical protein [Alphaproteobacteria bacterium]MBV9901560.1 hypothetical protein [Alphaproteobacteria bacterium]
MTRKHGAALMLAACLAAPVQAQPAQAPADAPAPAAQPQLVVAPPAPPPGAAGGLLVPKDTMVRLMVLNEVNTHDAKPGSRFVLRVDENVTVDGTVVIPVGAKAWGEVTSVKENAAGGKAGAIGARLLYVQAGDEQLALSGEERSKGSKGGDRVALAVVGFGIFGLLARGTQGKLKAGFIFNGYLAEDRLFDAAAGRFLPPSADPAPAAAAAQ